jgi:hypothetical protein
MGLKCFRSTNNCKRIFPSRGIPLGEWHEPLMRAALGESYAAISAAIHDFNFELARDQLRDAVARHGIEL